MTDRYPGYDVMCKQDTPSWDAITREVIAKRIAVPREPRFFDGTEWQTLGALCDRIMPQPADRPKVPLPAYVDATPPCRRRAKPGNAAWPRWTTRRRPPRAPASTT